MTAPRPVDIAHSPSRNVLVVTWDDGRVCELPVPYLRGWCPCARCQGHGGSVTFHEAPASTRIESIEETGAYAIAIRFSDGHDIGIYAWPWLRTLCTEKLPPTVERRG